jgi:hypothetical protein
MRQLRPDDRIILGGDKAIAAVNSGKEYIVYLEEGGRVELNLGRRPGALEAQWYNPRRGEYAGPKRQIGETELAVFSSPTQGPHKDWVLHICAEDN